MIARLRKLAQNFVVGLGLINNRAYKDFYKKSQTEEPDALKELGRLEMYNTGKVKGHHPFKPRLVDPVIIAGAKRSILCVATCNDEAYGLSTTTFTIRLIGILHLLALIKTELLRIYSRDVMKAFVTSENQPCRPIYMHAPKHVELKNGKYLH